MQQGCSNAFLHDELGPVHDPCYFIQFAEWASEWGLQYLAEVDLGTMAMAGLPRSAIGLLQKLAPDFLETQQLIDFLVNRSGRLSVLVRDDARIARELSVGELSHLEFTTSLEDARPRRSADEAACFRSAQGMEITLDDPCMSALVRRMSETATGAISFADLETCAVEQRHTASGMTRSLLALIGKGWAEPRLPIV